jgi:hypothetical protein
MSVSFRPRSSVLIGGLQFPYSFSLPGPLAVLFVESQLFVVRRSQLAGDEEIMNLGRDVERIAIRDDEVRNLPGLDGSNLADSSQFDVEAALRRRGEANSLPRCRGALHRHLAIARTWDRRYYCTTTVTFAL